MTYTSRHDRGGTLLPSPVVELIAHFAAVASAIMGVSGRAMLEALIARERDPQAVAEPATAKSRQSPPPAFRAHRCGI
ncbi:hypothetical protein RVN83_29830 [Streptomyces sp. PU10]|uniref:hypothetical protein n=1 Tax=Streptomyces TaxID=1883 RepID=UPI0013E0C144|nr:MULTISPECIES: hypothetical protein [Streptomyces]MBH5131856.1 hypothetical protein [Streptomyces sp. HB-N217]MDU0257197.1 hypothetical protein [Streptomyces sp. PU10]QKW59013.1 hypothetical protein HUT15_06305 [Streptomyces sp. NA03103]WSU06233.1 hypothetical protein OG368_07055 [Streptomyces sp. NBC_01124]